MNNRAVAVCFHKYTPFGERFYEPIFDYFIGQMAKFKNEFDRLYLLDSNWGIKKVPEWAEVIQVDPHDRYYDAYKKNLHKIKEDLVLFLDNDFVIYRHEFINKAFGFLQKPSYPKDLDYEEKWDIVSIYDTIGTYTSPLLNGKSKFCPYFFATRKELLMKYRDCDWGPKMPEYETLGKLTEEMLKDKIKPFEIPEDKSNILINGHKDGERGKDLGYYHIRSGSVPAILLAWLHAGDVKTYFDYLRNQPKTEYCRQIAWFWYMCYQTKNEKIMRNLTEVLQDVYIKENDWYKYFIDFVNYHNLPYEKNISRVN